MALPCMWLSINTYRGGSSIQGVVSGDSTLAMGVERRQSRVKRAS